MEEQQPMKFDGTMDSFPIIDNRVTFQETRDGLLQMAAALQATHEASWGNEALWEARIDGPVYRQTPILGRFLWYRQLRVWLLRRRLR